MYSTAEIFFVRINSASSTAGMKPIVSESMCDAPRDRSGAGEFRLALLEERRPLLLLIVRRAAREVEAGGLVDQRALEVEVHVVLEHALARADRHRRPRR